MNNLIHTTTTPSKKVYLVIGEYKFAIEPGLLLISKDGLTTAISLPHTYEGTTVDSKTVISNVEVMEQCKN